VKQKRFVRNLVAAKFEIVKTETTIVGPRSLTLFSTYSGVNSGSNYHPVGTTKVLIHLLCISPETDL